MAERQNVTTDIVIAGGGPVGLAAGCCLAETGLEVLLVDAGEGSPSCKELGRQAGSAEFDNRVSALTVASQNLLESLGAWKKMRDIRICPYTEMHVWDGEGTGAIHFTAADIHAESLGHIVENRLVTAALSEVAAEKPALKILTGEKLENINLPDGDDGVDLELAGGTRIRTRLLIGADGANSLVREQAGFRLRSWDYGHEAIVTTVETELPHAYTAWQRFTRTGPVAFLPLHLPGVDPSGQRHCSIVWSCVTEKAEGIKALDDDTFRQALGEAFEFRLGRILKTDSRISFPLWQRHATDYVRDHIALVGDAAHTIHPLAGQGVNLGLADVQRLSEAVTGALEAGEDFASHQVLSRYQRRRKGANLGMMAAMEGFKQLFGTDDPALTWLRNTGLKLTDQAPLLKQQLMRQAMGLG